MHNHYVSQFVIRRFSDAINIFDIHLGRIVESKRPNKVFYHDNIYDEETEKLFNYVESRVANIVSQKILGKESIVLTRKDLLLLKRYMLICSVRTQTPEEFGKIIRDFDKNADRYTSLRNMFFSDCGSLPSFKQFNYSDEELYAKALRVFATTNYFRDIIENSEATKELFAWAVPFLESYLAFWDASTDKEYLLTDCGMTSEYEGFHQMTGGLDISKASYLLDRLHKGSGEYAGLLASNCVMYENYSLFVLSSTRCMVMVNPFFRLYSGQQVVFLNSPEKKNLEVPDIWPAVIQNQNLFDIPQNKYVCGIQNPKEDDQYIYQPKQLTNEDMIYLNTLLLSQAKDIIGFDDPKKIIDSIYYFVWHQSNYSSVKSLHDTREEIMERIIHGVVNSPFQVLCKYCDEKGGVNKTEFLFLFEKLTDNIYMDFYTNPYLNQYYLDNPQETVANHALDFLGEGEKRLEVFRKNLERIHKERVEMKNV